MDQNATIKDLLHAELAERAEMIGDDGGPVGRAEALAWAERDLRGSLNLPRRSFERLAHPLAQAVRARGHSINYAHKLLRGMK